MQRRVAPHVIHSVEDKVDFAQSFATAMKPEVTSCRRAVRKFVRRRHDKTIRLYRMINATDIPSHNKTTLTGPFRPAGKKLRASLKTFCEDSFSFLNIFRREEFVVVERTSNRSFEDHHIRYQRSDCWRLCFLQLSDALLQLS